MAQITIFGIPNCNQIRNTREWFAQAGIEYQFHDFKKLGANQNTLIAWCSQKPWNELLNRNGTTWRKLTDAQKSTVHDAASAVVLMSQQPSIIKRPVVVVDGQIAAIGFNITMFEALKDKWAL